VIRVIGVLTLATAIAAGLVYLLIPSMGDAIVPPEYRSTATVAAALMVGAGSAAIILAAITYYRFLGLVKAAERMVEGDLGVSVSGAGRGLSGRLARAINSISVAHAETHDRATVDRLTGVANRQALLASLFAEVERASRYDRPLCIAFVDIDHFKAVNDTHGHGVGDIVLHGVAQTIADNLRASDLIGRYGGEEFMLILTETNVEEGAALAEKLRSLIERLRFEVEGNDELSVTISIGIVGGAGHHLRVDSLIRDADAAMYSAKSLGRNQTYIFEEPDDDARVPRAPVSEAGRARAIEIGRRARIAATAALTSVIAPLPDHRGRPSSLVTAIGVDMARQLQLPDAEIERIRTAALLHDIGKVAVPDEILDKPTGLTSAEWRTVVQHPRIGQVILEHAAALRDAVPIILHHHERYAGHGYPYGLRAREIPLGARIIAIADAYEAMTQDRPYKKAMTHDAAIGELRLNAGTQFDPELVGVFCDLYATTAPEPDPTVEAIIGSVAELGALDWGAREEPAAGSTTPSIRSRATLRLPTDGPRPTRWPRAIEEVDDFDGGEDQRSVASN
jgi:diguanylate cyclase (GGDEF)-like protein